MKKEDKNLIKGSGNTETPRGLIIYEKQNADEYLLHGKNAERLKSAFNQINNGLVVEKELIE